MEREPPTIIKASDIFCQSIDCFFTMIKPAKLKAMQTRVLERDTVKKEPRLLMSLKMNNCVIICVASPHIMDLQKCQTTANIGC